MDVESVQDQRVERVENRRPSEVLLALWRWRSKDVTMSFEEFADLADTWAQIRELEEIAARERRRPRFIDDLGEPDDRPKPKDPKKQGVVSIYYEVKELGHINVAIDCPEGMSEDAREAVVRKVWAKWHAEADEPREGQAPHLQTPTDRVSDSDTAEPDEEAEAEAKKARSLQSAKGFAERKRKALARVEAFRADGGTLAAIVEASGGKLTMDVLLDLIACKPQPVVTWAALEKALNKLGPLSEAKEDEK